MSVEKIFVVGAGLMGSGIAQNAITTGYTVTLNDQNQAALERAKANIEKTLNREVEKGRMTAEECAAAIARLSIDSTIESAKDADLVIEAIFENLEAKSAVFAKLEDVCPDKTIFASNTSSLSITEMANGLNHQLVGMHFFNPVPAMKLVEVIAGANTPAELVEYIKNLSIEIGKTPVVVNEAPGFVVNKILVPYCNEGVCVLQEGVASAEDIDIAMQLGANHPMGPLHLGDLIGWDVVLSIMDVLYNETGDSKYRANVLIRKMVRAGKLGIKSGEGFFNYKK